jgi:hypothetical protein
MKGTNHHPRTTEAAYTLLKQGSSSILNIGVIVNTVHRLWLPRRNNHQERPRHSNTMELNHIMPNRWLLASRKSTLTLLKRYGEEVLKNRAKDLHHRTTPYRPS